MKPRRSPWILGALLASGMAALGWSLFASFVDIPVRNWRVAVPANGSLSTLGDIGGAVPFVPVTPCRIVDTRNATGAYGGPKLAANTVRDFNLISGPCTGIPASATSFSLNFTVTQTDGAGHLVVYPTGGAVPTVSTINFTAGQTIANAAIVPATAGSISVMSAVSATHLLIDINGYFSPQLNAGRQLTLTGSVDSQALISATNTSPWAGSLAIKGTLTSAPIAGAAVKGVAPNGDTTYGVLGEIVGTVGYPHGSWGVVGAGKSGGVYGTAPTAGATAGVSGVVGEVYDVVHNSFSHAGVTGLSTGVNSSNGTGVIGRVGTATLGYPPGWGVVGAGGDGFGGVHGVVDVASTSGRAVYGAIFKTSTVSYQEGGILGYKNGGTSYGVFSEGNFGGTGAKYFVEPHPSDPEKVIRYVALEGPEAGTYFRGTGRTVGGQALIDVPESFRFVTDEEGITVQLTPVGELATIAVMSQDLKQIVVRSSKDVAFHYQVNGVRKAFRDHQAVAEGAEFRPGSAKARLPQYLPEASRQRLVDNGTYNADGTVNRRTADRLGWTREWEERAKAALAPAH